MATKKCDFFYPSHFIAIFAVVNFRWG
uniref:Uncharacterized protein n=1 Tax=Anguilla anguilla TaxID=7936 RepID=A0A0E9XHU6_ANGAN